jgi:hypothetical protein
MVENNGGQKVCITAWQFSAFNLSRNGCPHSELSYSINLHRLVPNPGKKNLKICCPILIIWAIFILFFVLVQNVSVVHWCLFTRPVNLVLLHLSRYTIQVMNSFKIQWNHLAYIDTFPCNNLNSKIWLVTCHFLYNSHFVHLHYHVFGHDDVISATYFSQEVLTSLWKEVQSGTRNPSLSCVN